MGIDGCYTEVDVDVLTRAELGTALIQGIAKVDIPCMESEIEGTNIWVKGKWEKPCGSLTQAREMASHSPKPAAADTVTQ